LLQTKLVLTIVGVAVVMLVIGVAIGSIAFPITKTETTIQLSTTTAVQTQTIILTLGNNNVTLVGVCTVVSYVLPDIVQEVSTVVTKVYYNTTYTTDSYIGIPAPTQTLGSSTYSSTITVHNITTYAVTSTSFDTNDLFAGSWSVTNCTFG
jgi:hypothetical protein